MEMEKRLLKNLKCNLGSITDINKNVDFARAKSSSKIYVTKISLFTK